MRFPCARCGSTYEIADELCLGRAVKVACPACGDLAVHRVSTPAPAAPAAGAASPPRGGPQPPVELTDEDFEDAWARVEGAARAEAGHAPASAAPAAGARTPEAARGAAAAGTDSAGGPPGRSAPAVRAGEEEPVWVAAELVVRRSRRRARLGGAAAAVAVLGAAVVAGGLAIRWSPGPAGGTARGARPGSAAQVAAGGSAGALSAADLAKLLGRRDPEPAPAPKPAAPERRPGASLAVEDRRMLDLLARKGDAPVTVAADEIEALSTSRGTLDEAAISGTLSRNSGSIAACVGRAVAASPDRRLPATRVALELTIRPSGRVERAAVQEPAIARLPLGQCIVQAARRMVFPGFDGPAIDLVVPLQLEVGP